MGVFAEWIGSLSKTKQNAGKFKTLPARDGEHDGTIRFVAFSARGLGSKDAAIKHRHEIEATCAAVSAAKPDFCLILGEPVSSGRGGERTGGASIMMERDEDKPSKNFITLFFYFHS